MEREKQKGIQGYGMFCSAAKSASSLPLHFLGFGQIPLFGFLARTSVCFGSYLLFICYCPKKGTKTSHGMDSESNQDMNILTTLNNIKQCI